MLKAQLRSKISALGSGWQDSEDLLTGDFFGVLDYLPRRPFLPSFLSWLARFNESVCLPPLDDVAWEEVEFVFWPMLQAVDDAAEPDLLIVSNRWVLVVEVKLDSGLGADQPWREYSVGKQVAQDRGLPRDAVFYLVVARGHLNVADTFARAREKERRELLTRTLQLRWSQAVALVEDWLGESPDGQAVRPEHVRMLTDLWGAMRRRRSIAFSGFEFVNQRPVTELRGTLFCPEWFKGFLTCGAGAPIQVAARVFLSRFNGFLENALASNAATRVRLGGLRFSGFLDRAPRVRVPTEPLLVPKPFGGFLEECPPCRPAATLELVKR
jgi:hypothetical protein